MAELEEAPMPRTRTADEFVAELGELGEEIKRAAMVEARRSLGAELKRLGNGFTTDDLVSMREFLGARSDWFPTPDIRTGLVLAGLLAESDEYEI